MKTILEILQLTTDFLKQKGFSNPRRQAQELISDALHLKIVDLYLSYDRPLTEIELKECRERLSRRLTGEPCAYIHGEVEFYNCYLTVSPSVLIPRQETGLLVDSIVQHLKSVDLENKVLWDVCSGSGCIGIALKKQFPSLNVVLSDISPDALKIATENSKKNNVEIECLQGDLLNPFEGRLADFIVCNPPYISEKEYGSLDPDVKNFEPQLALVAGPKGTEYYELLAERLPKFLRSGAKVWLEMGATQGESLKNLFSVYPWRSLSIQKDWAGHDRFFFLENE